MHDAVADQRKGDFLFEQEKQFNFILKISINELLSKMLFLCEKINLTQHSHNKYSQIVSQK